MLIARVEVIYIKDGDRRYVECGWEEVMLKLGRVYVVYKVMKIMLIVGWNLC